MTCCQAGAGVAAASDDDQNDDADDDDNAHKKNNANVHECTIYGEFLARNHELDQPFRTKRKKMRDDDDDRTIVDVVLVIVVIAELITDPFRSPGRFSEALGSASAGRAAANASASQLQVTSASR